MNYFRLSILIISSFVFSSKVYSIEAYVQPVIFYTPRIQPYLEIRIFINDKSFKQITSNDSAFFYRAVITLILKRGDSILNAEKIVLTSPAALKPGPLIYQMRWQLDGNDCELETKIEDGQDSTNELTLINKINPIKTKSSFLSEMQLSVIAKPSLDTNHILYKNGFYSEPIIYQHYNPGQNILYAYIESYATEELGKNYILKFIVSKKDSSGQFIQKEEWFKKRKTGNIDPYLLKYDISAFITGSYQLTVQILNIKYELQFAQSIEFTRDNPFWDKIDALARFKKEDKYFFDTLSEATVDYAIKSMYPLISSIEISAINYLFKESKTEEKRIFLFQYWSEQGDSLKEEARVAFKHHIELANKVNKLFFSGFGYGFETDRGYIYMKYGIPNEVISEDKDNGAYPYEIWKYNKIIKTGQGNVKFLFYNPDLAGSDFRLLHSNAHGERQNKKWEIELYRNVPNEVKGNKSIDSDEMQPGYNRRAREYFNY